MIYRQSGWFSLLFVALALLVAHQASAFEVDASGIVFQDSNQNGQRDRREPGLAGVVISDGVHVTRTDHEGRYRLSTESARVLFVSLPHDYSSNGAFYINLQDQEQVTNFDFPLLRHPSCDNLSFIFFTDSHVTPSDKYNAVAGMKQALAHMNEQKVSFVLSGGDLIMDALRACEPRAREQYELFGELASGMDVPLFNAPGNHELYGIYLEGVGDDACIVEEDDPLYGVGLYREYLGPDYYSFNWGYYHFMVLNTMGIAKIRNAEGDTARTYYGTVDSLQIEWMRKDLQMVPAETPIVLAGHIPFITAAHTFEGYSDYQVINYELDNPEAKSYVHVVSNASEVINEVLGDRALILALAGHHHHFEVDRWADSQHDATFVVGGSVAGQWWQGDRRIAGSTWPEGYVLVHLKNGRLEDLEYMSFDWKGYKE